MSGETRTDANGVIGTPVAKQVAEAARMLREIRKAVESGDLTASRGERDRLRGASVALDAMAETR